MKVIDHMRKEAIGRCCTVEKVQSNSLCNIYEDDTQKNKVWIDFPKASNFSFENDVAKFYFPDNKLIVAFQIIG